MNKKFRFIQRTAILLCLVGLAAAVYAQEEEYTGMGTSLTLILKADMINIKNKTFEASNIRNSAYQNQTISKFLYSNPNFFEDSVMYLGYNGKYFGGRYGFQGSDNWAGVNGWFQIGFLKFYLGNDISNTFVDTLGADPGMRIYSHSKLDGETWDGTYLKTDDLTQGEGVLVQALLGNFNIALAAGEFLSTYLMSGRIVGLTDENKYVEYKGHSFRYSGRVGYEMGDLGLLNFTYVFKGNKTESYYGLKDSNSMELIPVDPRANEYTHLFGLFGTFYLPGNFAVTTGYNGLVTQYTEEFWKSSAYQKAGYPVIFRNGVNLNARYDGIPGLTLRTDNCLTFWQDKNYDLFGTKNPKWTNLNVNLASLADDFAVIDHLIMKNGIGVSYRLSEQLSATFYVSNTFSNYSVTGLVPSGVTGEYTYIRNNIGGEVGVGYRISSVATLSVSVNVYDMIISRSLDLNRQSESFFESHVNNIKTVPVATTDNELTVSIPVNLTIRL